MNQQDKQTTRVKEGAFHLPGFLSLPEQERIASLCLELGKNAAGFYQPVLRSGAKMRLRMMCLGRHWNAKTYNYELHRSDVDGLAVQPVPATLAKLAERAATLAEFSVRPDILLVNWYGKDGRLGLHQDKDERPETLQAGIPVVSFSIGDTCEFIFGGLSRSDPRKKIALYSGDAFIFGGPARLCFHGVGRVVPRTGPSGVWPSGRLNLTFRQF